MTVDLSSFTASKRVKWLFILVLLIALALTLWSQWPHLFDRYRVIKDVQNFYWMALYRDPTLFPVDYLYLSGGRVIGVDVFAHRFFIHTSSPGYGLLFYLASPLIEHVWLTKFLVFALMSLCVVFLYKLGRSLGNDTTILNLSLLFVFIILASPQSISIASGLQRAFAVPILIVFIYYMTVEKYCLAALMILVAILIYAPDFPLMALAYGLSLLKVERPFRLSLDLSWQRLVPFFATLLLSLLVIGLIMASRSGLLDELAPSPRPLPSADVSPPPLSVTSEEDASLSESSRHQAEGSVPLFSLFPWFGRAGVFDIGADVLNFVVLLSFGFVIYRVVGPRSLRRLPSIFWCLLVASVIMYAVSLFAILGLSTLALYLPSRYTRSTLILTILYFVGLNWADFLSRLPGWLQKNSRLLIFFIVSLCLALGGSCLLSPLYFPWRPTWLLLALAFRGVVAIIGGGIIIWGLQKPVSRIVGKGRSWKSVARVVAFLALGVVTAILGAEYIRTLETKPINPSPVARNVHEFVGTLPKDAVLAGESDVMTGIPLFSKRIVLFRRLFPRKDAPIAEFFDAQYAESPGVILDFCERYGVDYLVIDAGVFDPDYLAKARFFYQPYNDEIVKLVAGRSDFVLLDVEPVFASGSLSVIECDAETLLVGD